MSSAMQKGQMLAALQHVEDRLLPPMLGSLECWTTLDVDYEPPRVERLWAKVHYGEEELRVYLHRIHPCAEALWHPHPWPSAIHILTGEYEMSVGYGPGEALPENAATLLLPAGSRYEMICRDGWHSVRPTGMRVKNVLAASEQCVLSVMVTAKPWSRWSPRPTKALDPLDPTAAKWLLDEFRYQLTLDRGRRGIL